MTYTFSIQFEFDAETGQVCAVIPALNHLSDYGDNFQKAERNILEAAKLYIAQHPNVETDTDSVGTKILVQA